MLSADLAELYEVEPRVLVQAVQRNRERFSADLMFQLTGEESAHLKSQNVISSWGGAATFDSLRIQVGEISSKLSARSEGKRKFFS